MDMTKLTKPARKLLKLKKCGAVIVAAGSASRMGGIDKVMAQLGGEPMILRDATNPRPKVGAGK
jgi:CTP:molybdopterin cytidylyltransferase MocA